MTKSSELFAEAKKRIPGGVNSPVRAFRGVGGDPFFVERAAGARLWDVDGRELIDFVGTWGPAILGHAPQVVRDAIVDAVDRGVSFGVPHPGEVDMARTLCEWVPSMEKVRMVNSGTEATMSCIRLARGFTNKDMIIKFNGCYHGHVDSLLVRAGSGALTHGHPDSAGVPHKLAKLTITLPYNDLPALRYAFASKGLSIAAVIVESIPANAGLYMPEPGFYEELWQLCAQNGSLVIFDEVMTGFRLSRGGYQQLAGLTPDLTALGKVIGGGLPVGAFGGRAEIMDMLSPDGPVYQAGTLSGNPLALAAGLAQLRELERVNGWSRLEELGADFEDRIRAGLKRAGRDYNFRRIGSMFCLYFTGARIRNLEEAQQSDRAVFAKFFHRCLEKGVYFAPSQFEAGFISLAHTHEDLAHVADVASEALAHL
jgi:glutamate-1-semialdehyde 2,1-aminomutase